VLSGRARDRIFWVGHELTDKTRRYLCQRLMAIVLDQAPEIQARRSIDLTLKSLGLMDVEVSTEPVRFLTVTSENL
jgi:LacI family transcriptional regulator